MKGGGGEVGRSKPRCCGWWRRDDEVDEAGKIFCSSPSVTVSPILLQLRRCPRLSRRAALQRRPPIRMSRVRPRRPSHRSPPPTARTRTTPPPPPSPPWTPPPSTPTPDAVTRPPIPPPPPSHPHPPRVSLTGAPARDSRKSMGLVLWDWAAKEPLFNCRTGTSSGGCFSMDGSVANWFVSPVAALLPRDLGECLPLLPSSQRRLSSDHWRCIQGDSFRCLCPARGSGLPRTPGPHRQCGGAKRRTDTGRRSCLDRTPQGQVRHQPGTLSQFRRPVLRELSGNNYICSCKVA